MSNLNFPNQFIELCGITITNTNEPINILSCYKPPSPSFSQDDWDVIINNISVNSKTIFVGDFNSHNQA